jgi:hypothetical protein
MGKNHLASCMNLIEENDIDYMEEGKIDGTVGMETSIVLLQTFKDRYFKNGENHIRRRRCINNKVKNWDNYCRRFMIMKEYWKKTISKVKQKRII